MGISLALEKWPTKKCANLIKFWIDFRVYDTNWNESWNCVCNFEELNFPAALFLNRVKIFILLPPPPPLCGSKSVCTCAGKINKYAHFVNTAQDFMHNVVWQEWVWVYLLQTRMKNPQQVNRIIQWDTNCLACLKCETEEERRMSAAEQTERCVSEKTMQK